MTQYNPMCASAPIDSDLLDASNWTFSNSIPWVVQDHAHGGPKATCSARLEGKMIIKCALTALSTTAKAPKSTLRRWKSRDVGS